MSMRFGGSGRSPGASPDAATLGLKDNREDLRTAAAEYESSPGGVNVELGPLDQIQESSLDAVARVAIILSKGAEPGKEFPDAEIHAKVPETVQVCAGADLKFYGSPRKLLICCLRRDGAADDNLSGSSRSPDRVAVQLERLRYILDDAFHELQADDGPWMWPLHDMRTNTQIIGMEIFESSEKDLNLSRYRRLLLWFHMQVPRGGGPFINTLQVVFGSSAAYLFSWAYYYIQRLWVLAGIVIVMLILRSDPNKAGSHKVLWVAFKVLLLLWGGLVTVGSTERKRFVDVDSFGQDDAFLNGGATRKIRNPRFRGHTGDFNRLLKLIFLVMPVVVVFLILVTSLLWTVVQFNVWLTFGWGDCVRRGCFDPEELHGFSGWLAEVGSDVALALVFEGLLALSSALGTVVADLHNYEHERDFNCAVLMYSITLEAIGKVVPYAVLALHFVPQWAVPNDDLEADCSDLASVAFFGEASMSCLARRLPLKTRRFVLERSMKGPFIVAPFVAILVKVIIPWVVDRLDLLARKTTCCCECSDQVSDGLFHLLSLIFTYDGDSVNCFQYVWKGWPFTELEIQPNSDPDDGDANGSKNREQLVHQALQQSVRKPFEPLDELLELKLNFLWVLFFAPLSPAGVLFTLASRLLEVRFKLSKMLFVRRRVFPCDSRSSLMHVTQYYFVRGATLFALVWYAILSLVTYNDRLYKNSLIGSSADGT